MAPIEFEYSRGEKVFGRGVVPEEKGNYQIGNLDLEVVRVRRNGRGPNGKVKAAQVRIPKVSPHSEWIKFNEQPEVSIKFPKDGRLKARRV